MHKLCLFHNLASMSEKIYIPVVAVCPVRESADHRSEMTSQLLLGEQVHVMDASNENWLQVRSLHDGYEGWCQRIQLAQAETDMPEIEGYFSGTNGMANVNGQPMQVFMGTPVYKGQVLAGGFKISFTGLVHRVPGVLADREEVLKTAAFQYLNASYVWGGRTFAGIDCSGFAQMVYRQ